MHLEHLYSQISSAIGCQKPEKDYLKLTEQYRQITEVLRKDRMIKQWHANIQQWNPEYTQVFHGKSVELLIPAEADIAFREFKHQMDMEQMLILEPNGMAMGTRVGMQASIWQISPGVKFDLYKKIVSP